MLGQTKMRKCNPTRLLILFVFLIELLDYEVSSETLASYASRYPNRKNKVTTAEDFDDIMHSSIARTNSKYRLGSNTKSQVSSDPRYWFKEGQGRLQNQLKIKDKIETQAKNVIMFMGDGMSSATVTAARIFKGQLEGSVYGGEESELHFESFPHVALSKTFCVDGQVADSACSATAYLSGTKGNIQTIGLNPNVLYRDCRGQMNTTNQAKSILAWAQAAGKSTGIVTTTRITHASPAGTYGHAADRTWESDKKMKDHGVDSEFCDDIAEQLILGKVGSRINVILGGGRREFTPTTYYDIETKQPGRRRDGKNLLKMWQNSKPKETSKYVWNRETLLDVDPVQTDHLLGLFSYDHMDFVTDADPNLEPTLSEMTKVAIEILSRNPNGYFLFVEGGRIDHAHHGTKAQKALVETLSLDLAVETASRLTSVSDTTTVVTADHSHTMTISGYPKRGNPILGFAGYSEDDELPYSTLSYANGPGFKIPDEQGFRYDMSNDNLVSPDYRQMTGFHMESETHGGDDVIIYSKGPFSHLLSGVQQQSYIPHVLGYAACMGPGLHFCDSKNQN